MKWNGHLMETAIIETHIEVMATIYISEPKAVCFQNVNNVFVGPVKDPTSHVCQTTATP